VVTGQGFAGHAGTSVCTSASRSSLPCSTNCIASTAVIGLLIEARR
jgi:phosphate/sulfate permease